MATTTDLTTLKINYLTQAQYNAAKTGGTINENEIYLTPDKITIYDTVSSIVIGDSTNTSEVHIWGSSTNKVGVSAKNTTDNEQYALLVKNDHISLHNSSTSSDVYNIYPNVLQNLSVITSSFSALNAEWTASYDGFMLMAMHTDTAGNSLLRVQDVTGTARYVMMLAETSTSQAVYVSGMFPVKKGNKYKINTLTNATVYYAYVQYFG